MAVGKTYVREEEQGILRVGRADVSLDSIVIAFQDGCSPEAIQQQYPALSLEEVYGAITFYLANREEVHCYLERQEQRWQEVRQKVEQAPSPVVERLRALRPPSGESMSRPRFLADNDLKEPIILGTLRREAAIEFPRLRDRGLENLSDADVLAYAAGRGLALSTYLP